MDRNEVNICGLRSGVPIRSMKCGNPGNGTFAHVTWRAQIQCERGAAFVFKCARFLARGSVAGPPHLLRILDWK